MSLRVNVKGGTGGGRKKPPRDKPRRWIHICGGQQGGVELPGYMASCPRCRIKRP